MIKLMIKSGVKKSIIIKGILTTIVNSPKWILWLILVILNTILYVFDWLHENVIENLLRWTYYMCFRIEHNNLIVFETKEEIQESINKIKEHETTKVN